MVKNGFKSTTQLGSLFEAWNLNGNNGLSDGQNENKYHF